MLLRRSHRPAHHLKDVARRADIPVLHSHRNRQHVLRAQVARRARWYRRDQPAIRQAARPHFHRLEQSRECATRANRINQVAVRHHYRFAAIQVGGDHCHRDVQFLKLASLENSLNQVAQPVITGKAQPRNAPPGNIAQAQGPASRYDARQRRAASVGRAQDASHAGSRDTRYRYVVLFQHPQDAQMRKSPRKAASQSQSNPWPCGRCCPLERAKYVVIRHALRMPASPSPAYGSHVPKKQYLCTSLCEALKNAEIVSPVLSYYHPALSVPLASADQSAILIGVGT